MKYLATILLLVLVLLCLQATSAAPQEESETLYIYDADAIVDATTYYFIALFQYDNTVLNGTENPFTRSGKSRAPTVTTKNATNITTASATLNMAYDFMKYRFVHVQFRYKAEGESAWDETGWVAQSGSGTHSFSEPILGLSSNKTYYFMALLKYDGIALNGTEVSFTTSGESRPPTVTTENATNIATASATLNMTYDFMDYRSVQVQFRYKVEGASAWNETGWVSQAGSSSHSFSEPIADLSSNKTYYFMAQLKYEGTVLNGTEVSFTTSGEPRAPAVTTENATNIATASATLNMTYDFMDYSSVHVQFMYKAEGASAWNETGWVAQTGSGSHSFSESIAGLSSNKTYYFMAQLKYDGTVLNGTEISFTTSGELRPPTVTTKNATNITTAAATLNMAYDFMDYNSVQVQFRYKVEGASAWNETGWVAQSGSGSGSGSRSFSEPIAGLYSNTTHYFMAQLKYDGAVLNDTEISFTTSGELRPPTVSTKNATNITVAAATLNMAYDFMDYRSVHVQFMYKAEGASAWNGTGWITQTGSGSHSFSEPIAGLSSNKTYYSMAQLKYDGTVLNGTEIPFTTSGELRQPAKTILIYNADAVIDLTASTPPDDTLNSSDALPQEEVKTILIYNADAVINLTASTPPDDALNSSDALPQDGVKTILIYNADAFIDHTASTPPDDALNSSDALPQDGVKTILIYNADAFIDITTSTPPDDALDSSDALPQDSVKTIFIYDADATDSLSLKAIEADEYNPKLEIPVYTPYWIYAHKGTGLTYTIKVTNEGTKTDTIILSTSNTQGWGIQLSQTSVTLAPGQSTRVYLLLTIEEYADSNSIMIMGTSQGDTSKNSDCTVYATGLGEGQGLFAATLIFKSNDAQEHILELEAPDDVKISDDTVTVPPSPRFKKVNVAFDPKASSLGSNLISIDVTDSLSGEGAWIYILFEGDETIATSFDMATDSYSFPNWGIHPNTGKCYGMSETSILYFLNIIALPYNAPNTYSLTKEFKVIWNIQIHQWRLNMLIAGGEINFDDIDITEEYNKLQTSMGNGKPMILAVKGHVVVAYKIVREDDKAYIFVYNSDAETYDLSNELNFALAFPYAIYNLTSHEFNYDGDTEFLVREAERHPFEQIILVVNCPVNVTITDQYNRIISDDGTNEIPDALIITSNEQKLFYLPTELTYHVDFNANDAGKFTTTAVSPVSDNTAAIKVFDNISITENTHATLDLAANEENPMNIDYDGDGTTDEEIYPDVNETIEINQPPNASFTYSPAHPVVNEAISFNASESKDHDGYITNYKWEFGDGNITDTTEPIINQTYALAGEYTVNLTVTDDDGATNATAKMITVSGMPDLVITEKWLCWPDNCTICYNVTNTGTGTAPACHNTALYVDGVEVAHDHVPVDLAPGESYTGCFNGYIWAYTPPSDNVTVCADNNETVDELDETNNCLTNIWMCGDVRKDGFVTAWDVAVLNSYVAGIGELEVEQKWAGDVRTDGYITAWDVAVLNSKVAGIGDISCMCTPPDL